MFYINFNLSHFLIISIYFDFIFIFLKNIIYPKKQILF